MVAYLYYWAAGIVAHKVSSKGGSSSEVDLQLSVLGDDAVLDAWLGVERQTGALGEAEGDSGSPKWWGCAYFESAIDAEEEGIAKGFWPFSAFRYQIYYSQTLYTRLSLLP